MFELLTADSTPPSEAILKSIGAIMLLSASLAVLLTQEARFGTQ